MTKIYEGKETLKTYEEMTNLEFVDTVIFGSGNKRCMSALMLDAIGKYSSNFADMPEPEKHPQALICPVRWWQVGQEIAGKFEKGFPRAEYGSDRHVVEHLMLHSKYGALCQSFVLEALHWYTSQLMENDRPPKTLDETNKTSPDKWWECGALLLAALEEKYGKR
ncbi:hypothetical protein N9112_00275 [bacterium]|nr:hypothetical protein [bacterium]